MTTYIDFLQKRHSHFNTDQSFIDQAVKDATESTIKNQEKIIGGEANEVHKVTTEHNDSVFVRIMHDRKFPLLREKWAVEQCRNIGIPAPNILYTKQFKHDGKLLTISVQETAVGTALRKYEETDTPDELYQYTKRAGEILARIHSIQTVGFGKKMVTEKDIATPIKRRCTNHSILWMILRKHANKQKSISPFSARSLANTNNLYQQ